MPLYDYKCNKCGKIFEAEQRISEKPLEKCIFCSGQVKRIISASGIVFKGSGFHVNDYRKDPRPAADRPTPARQPKKEPPKTSSGNK